MISPGLIAQARSLAAVGKAEQAGQVYQQAFGNLPPPLEFAYEYYMTVAGTERGWQIARDGLASMARRAPNDAGIQIAYGQVLTYREVTRREGIALLARYAGRDETALKFWRSGLLWLEAQAGEAGLYEDYLKAYPDDAEVAAAYRKLTAPVTADTTEHAFMLGLAAINAGKLGEAEDYLDTALRLDPGNANALASLASLRLRQGRPGDALALLKQAIAAAPDRRAEFAQAYDSAAFLVTYQSAVAAMKAGHPARAEQLLRPIAYGGNKDRRNALALLGDALAKQGKDAEAEKVYRQVLQGNPGSRQALLGLYGVLIRQNKVAEANALAARIPAQDRARFEGGVDAAEAGRYRSEAERLALAGQPDAASAVYQKALATDAGNPWVRLSYARFLLRQGDSAQAQGLMAPLTAPAAPGADALYAAALFAVDQNRFQEAIAQVNRIPGPQRTPAITAFAREITVRHTIAQARAAFDGGNRTQAIAAMRSLAARGDLSPATRGELASALYDMGDTEAALALARTELAKGIPAGGQVSDYAALAAVLARSGNDAEAGALLIQLQPLVKSPSDQRGLQDLRNSMTVQRAGQLRLEGKLAPAYDLLAQALRSDPNDPVLLAELANLYAAGKMYPEATSLYDGLMARMPNNQTMVLQATNVAIASGDYGRAHELLDPLLDGGQPTAQTYFVAGQLARAEGDTGGAIEALEHARSLRAQELGIAETDMVAPPAGSPPPRRHPGWPPTPSAAGWTRARQPPLPRHRRRPRRQMQWSTCRPPTRVPRPAPVRARPP
ncbi:hypothetical protein D3874_13640 [Oleomonas cavernae]|uniref:PEP-CTERM system TPR-repeat protein PrsT n=1 Tax=Oleomonas cavernae TaxID=2320859 RepID=A0A418WD60_9PROT|nr:tetratricopeptide repeat protein [Oleomonas cavernae]RJF87934.1 hypothetical protein D3874_13640 [Oleomonas cavernae]